MSRAYTDSMERLMTELKRLPGVGPRSAERLAYHLLQQPAEEALKLAQAIQDVKTRIRNCNRCYNLSEGDLCEICQSAGRDQSVICVVEQHNDLISLEETGLCNWVYHVLLGHLAPLEGITPEELTIDALVARVEAGGVQEIVMATNPTVEGDGTALYISSLLEPTGVRISRLARGLPSGGSIEFASKNILSDAIQGRTRME